MADERVTQALTLTSSLRYFAPHFFLLLVNGFLSCPKVNIMLEETIPSFVPEPSKLATEQKIMMDRQKLERVEIRERSDSIVSTACWFYIVWR
jgi:hypothetical protein